MRQQLFKHNISNSVQYRTKNNTFSMIVYDLEPNSVVRLFIIIQNAYLSLQM
jgi:hypothetical protein